MISHFLQRFKVSHLVWLYFLFNLVVSQILLPRFNANIDFLFFSTWRLFSGGVRENVYDLTWDEGKTYYFRDYRRTEFTKNIDTVTLMHLLQSDQLNPALQSYVSIIKSKCQCQEIEIHQLSGSLYDHIIQKKNLTAKKVIKL